MNAALSAKFSKFMVGDCRSWYVGECGVCLVRSSEEGSVIYALAEGISRQLSPRKSMPAESWMLAITCVMKHSKCPESSDGMRRGIRWNAKSGPRLPSAADQHIAEPLLATRWRVAPKLADPDIISKPAKGYPR